MRIEEIERFFREDLTVQQVADQMNHQRSQALLQADRQLDHDQCLCDIMECWTRLAKLARPGRNLHLQPDVRKALLIARTAIEVAADLMTEVKHPVPIRRVP